jgi:hypothetical protein
MMPANNDKEKAPVFKGWGGWYALVLITLLLLIIFFYFFTKYYS